MTSALPVTPRAATPPAANPPAANPPAAVPGGWLPGIEDRSGPRYLAIADHLARDIRSGRLPPGTRLPTHRDLAYRLKVTVGTVTRAYAEAERRGLIGGEVGRGTFVRGAEPALPHFAQPPRRDPSLIDLSLNFPSVQDRGPLLAATLTELAATDPTWMLSVQPHAGLPDHRAAGAEWLQGLGLPVPPERVTVCDGAQHAMMAAFAALTAPGDLVLTEALTYPGMKVLANHLHLRLRPVACDQDGLLPEAFEAACRTGEARALYCMPTLHNPTNAILPLARRQALGEIATRYGVAIVEDDLYRFLVPDAPPPIAALAPDVTFHVTSTSKCLAPGLRIGFLVAPPAAQDAVEAAMRATVWTATPLTAEVATRWIRDGTMEQLTAQQQAECRARQAIAASMLAGHTIHAYPTSFHLWLRLPEPWRSAEFTAAARRRGVAVTPAEAFALGRGSAPHAVRLCLVGATDRTTLAEALERLAALLAEPAESYLSVV